VSGLAVITSILMGVFGGFSLILALYGLVHRPVRSTAWPAALAAAGAAFGALSDSFWTMTSLGLIALWLGFMALPIGEAGWRFRFGLVKVVGILGFVLLWPSLDSMTGGVIPCPKWVKERVTARLVAGLDLRGGLRLVYTVDVAEAVKDKRDAYYEEMRRELAKLYAGHEGDDAPKDAVIAKLREVVDLSAPRSPANLIKLSLKPGADPAKLDARFRAAFQADLDLRRIDDRNFEFTVREATESGIRERAVAQAKDIILRRVDSLGLREAAVSTRDEDIIIEVPGQDEAGFQEIREIISQTARLEFKMVDDESPFFRELSERGAAQALPDGLEFRSEQASVGVDAKGEQLFALGTYAYLPIAPGETSEQTLRRLRDWADTLTPPPDREIGFEIVRSEIDETTLKEKEIGWRTYLLRAQTEVTGDQVRDAAAQPDQSSNTLGGWYVALTFTDRGGDIFEEITGNNVKRRFAILLDGKIESAPVIQDRISGGHASITMGSSDPTVQLRDARKLELVLRSGALPAPISPSNEQRIGPSLGRDSIRLALEGAFGGGALVLLFMLFYYRTAGLIADISVITNVFLQLAVLASFGASMTLPGIAGLALTVGMGVDANVLINERIREEIAAGKSPRAAVEVGYSKALSAIVDGQLTTLIAGIVLAQYGTGPIKGFAVTLMVGVVVSIFTGVVMSRTLFDIWVRALGKKGSFSLG
jgi:preprotein translocase subunit SecD